MVYLTFCTTHYSSMRKSRTLLWRTKTQSMSELKQNDTQDIHYPQYHIWFGCSSMQISIGTYLWRQGMLLCFCFCSTASYDAHCRRLAIRDVAERDFSEASISSDHCPEPLTCKVGSAAFSAFYYLPFHPSSIATGF
ncbi:hypothetical protein LOAG_06019 [Loa loa]|uniref:Uncharacterized protein n=1 Tax=Loa loa TaxID=7209 RepID=A0A1S0TYI9_LOALO|nr:hypothetical protein LOAG_06019 [Loa loa]EFO22464.1 hypothetical protein LOAG_06019 [Loa loa]